MKKRVRSREPVGTIPVKYGSQPHHLLLYLRSSNGRPKPIAELYAMNSSSERRRVKERTKSSLVKNSLAIEVEPDVYQITEYGVKVLVALAARNSGVAVVAPDSAS